MASRMSGRRSSTPRPRRPRARSTVRSRALPSTTTIRSSPRRRGTTSSSPTGTAPRYGSATSAGRWTEQKIPSSAPGGRHAMHLLAVFKQPGANVIDAVNRVGRRCRFCRRRSPRRSMSRSSRIAPRRSVPRSPDVRIHAGDHHRAGGRGDLCVPAQPVGDDHPRHRGSAVADRDVRGDVPARLQPRQSVADGADDRRRLCGRRRDRHAGEHFPPHRGRR